MLYARKLNNTDGNSITASLSTLVVSCKQASELAAVAGISWPGNGRLANSNRHYQFDEPVAAGERRPCLVRIARALARQVGRLDCLQKSCLPLEGLSATRLACHAPALGEPAA